VASPHGQSRGLARVSRVARRRCRYGFTVFQPFGNLCLAASSETDGGMIVLVRPPVDRCPTVCLAVSWQESSRRSVWPKLRPVLIGYRCSSDR